MFSLSVGGLIVRLSQSKAEHLLGGAFVEFSFIRVGNKSSDQAVFNGGCTTADGLQLIEGELGVDHWIDWLWRSTLRYTHHLPIQWLEL